MFLPLFHLPTRAEVEYGKQRKRERLAACVPWSADIKWQMELNIQASTYPVRPFFNGELTESKDGLWQYKEKVISAGDTLGTFQGSRMGNVLFDGEVKIPCLFKKDQFSFTGWGPRPWMSLTPMEMLTLRAGTKFAKGHTVIAGLGLGHQLIEVAHKKTVKKITIVEKCQELADFVWDEIKKHLPANKPVDLIIGDAYQEVPKLTADVALVDIFPNYGSNRFEIRDFEKFTFGYGPVPCPNIKRIWVWGAADVKGDEW